MNRNKGFTIIELIVVIAIIAVLASIVLSNVVKYIGKSKDQGIKSEMNQLGIQASVYFEKNGDYSSFCDAPEIQPLLQRIGDFAGLPPECNNGVVHWKVCCRQAASSWAACTELIVYNTKAWCVDNTGRREQIDNSDCKNSMSVCP
jgi:prepilin-type N-terminal cleavage/methylation domain-containing protein